MYSVYTVKLGGYRGVIAASTRRYPNLGKFSPQNFQLHPNSLQIPPPNHGNFLDGLFVSLYKTPSSSFFFFLVFFVSGCPRASRPRDQMPPKGASTAVTPIRLQTVTRLRAQRPGSGQERNRCLGPMSAMLSL